VWTVPPGRLALLPTVVAHALLAAVLAACAPEEETKDEPQPSVRSEALPRPGPAGETLLVEGLANGGFELVADSTTSPAKYGAYWVGAFSFEEGDPADRIEHGEGAADGSAWLALAPGEPGVLQKLVADPRWSERLVVHLAWRGAGRLAVTLEDGPERRTEVLAPDDGAPDAHGWRRVSLALGAAFAAEHGGSPVPRLNLHLEARGGAVDVDATSAEVSLPLVQAAEAQAIIEELVKQTMRSWVAAREEGGLGLVDRDTGYVIAEAFDVITGDDVQYSPIRHVHSMHNLLARWIRHCDANGRQAEADRWRTLLHRFVTSLLDTHFDPDTGLPRVIHTEKGAFHKAPVTVGAFVEFLMEVRDLVGDPELAARCEAQVRAIGDTLLALQGQHDLDPSIENELVPDRTTGTMNGVFVNWYGHMPNRLTPKGEIDQPKMFNTSWAIVTGRSFWYHLLKSPAAVMAAHEVQPRAVDLKGIARAVGNYDRPWDAARYDLENDTDDHYGYLAEDIHTLLAHGGAKVQGVLPLLQSATDHRLARDVGGAGETVWIQAIRLGTECAGDSPRAFKGVLDLYELSPEDNPISSGLPLYREALRELAANDFKGRQLTNSQFTESFFGRWEMVCICFKGTYQGDCREHRIDYWDGDVGDIFGGPPLQSINAQVWAWRVAQTEAEKAEILARLGTIHYVTETSLRQKHGYLYGLDRKIAQQYELPDKYTTGLDKRTSAGLGYVLAWMELLPFLGGE
jgi:hypothetical protein